LERGLGVRIAFVFQQNVEIGIPFFMQIDVVEQVGKLFLQVGVDEAADCRERVSRLSTAVTDSGK
jgi:hypothetical protein